VEHRVLRHAQEAESMTCQARLTVLARAVDKDGRTVWMSSDAFDLSSPLVQCEAAKRGTTSFEREVTLPPNVARVDVIAYDALAERASVKEFEVRARSDERHFEREPQPTRIARLDLDQV
jgi:hypothetical protein